MSLTAVKKRASGGARRVWAQIGLLGLAISVVIGVLPTSTATAFHTSHRARVAHRAGATLPVPYVPAPPPSPSMLAQAAADRPDPFVPAAVGRRLVAVPTPAGKWLQAGDVPIGSFSQSCGFTGCFPPPANLGGGKFGGVNAGRVDAVAVIPSGTHAGWVVVGTAGGGIVIVPNGPYPDFIPKLPGSSLAIGALAVDPANPDHVIAGTGEAYQTSDSYVGDGLLSSTDDGGTWAAQNPTYTSSAASTTYGPFSAKDTSAVWTVNQWAGAVVRQGPNWARVATNTTNTLTLDAFGWQGGPPPIPPNFSSFTVRSFDGEGIAQVAFDPGNSARMFAATNEGLFVSTDGGLQWAKPPDPSYASVDGIVTAVVVIPGTAGPTVYLAGNTGVARSTDGGVHWAPASSGLSVPAASTLPFIALAAAPTNPATLYASVGNNASPVTLYRATDGNNPPWTNVSAPDYTGNAYAYGSGTVEQGQYDNVVVVDPANATHVLAGGETVVETTNATGSPPTWTNINGQSFFGSGTNLLHPDQHALAFAPDGSVWIGNDGGLYHYQVGKITNASGFNAVQFYFGFTESPGRGVLGGTQDNSTTEGYPVFFGLPPVPYRGPTGWQSNNNWNWDAIGSGDGGPATEWWGVPKGQTSLNFYGAWEQNKNLLIDDGPDFPISGSATQITPPGVNLTKTVFTPPMIQVPNPLDANNPTLFYGGPDLYRTTNPTASPPTWTQVTTVGGTAGTAVTAIAAAPSNPKVVYVGFKNGTIRVSTDGGQTFPTSLAAQPFPVDTWITGLSVDPTNPRKITASVSYNDTRVVEGSPGAVCAGTGCGNPTPLPHVAQYSYTTNPATGTWTVITGNLPPKVGVSRVIYDNGALVAATDAGVYATGAPNGNSTVWSIVGTSLPQVQVQDLYRDPETGVLFAVTHGRGAWELHAPIFGAAVAGDDGSGQLGIGPEDMGLSTRPVIGCCPGPNVKAVAGGSFHELALLTNGAMRAWGDNFHGELGIGTNTGPSCSGRCYNTSVTVKLPAGKTATAIAAGASDFSLALLNDGSVASWGYNVEGELGNGTNTNTNLPVKVSLPAGKTAKTIAAGYNFSLARLNDGSVWTWGANNFGQLGNGTSTGTNSNVPVRVALPVGKTAVAIAAGQFHGLALLNDGTVWAWGNNAEGELGNGTNTGPSCGGSCSSLPVQVALPAGTTVTALAGGRDHSLALLNTGSAMAWGDNSRGQLGTGSYNGANCGGTCIDSPVKVALPTGLTATALAAGYQFSMALMSNQTAYAWGANDSGQLGNGTANTSNTPVMIDNSTGATINIAAGRYDSLMTVSALVIS